MSESRRPVMNNKPSGALGFIYLISVIGAAVYFVKVANGLLTTGAICRHMARCRVDDTARHR